MNGRRPGNGRYAHPEREQRWLLGSVPKRAILSGEITDRYLTGTSLRVRRVEGPDGVVHKLTQKVRPGTTDPTVVMLTTIYLPADEVTALCELPHAELRKTRRHLEVDGRTIAVDEFHDRLDGLVLAEAELSVSEDRLPQPPFALREVTDDPRYTGGWLATAGDAEVAALLAEAGSGAAAPDPPR